MSAELPMYYANKMRGLACWLIVGWCLAVIAVPAAIGQERADIVAGIDHVPIAVADLDSAAATFARMGFALKPGRPHDNGIRNFHIKFPDGTELELITAPEARDNLTREYRAFLEHGDGPAFVALYAPDKERLSEVLDTAGLPHSVGWGVAFAQDHPLRYVFFGSRNASPTDKPEHFRHTNGARSLTGVWLAADMRDVESTLLSAIESQPQTVRVVVPNEAFMGVESVGARVVTFAEGTLTFLPAEFAMSGAEEPHRPIVGVTLRTGDLEETQKALQAAGFGDRLLRHGLAHQPDIHESDRAQRSLFVHPDDASGLWIEFREER